MANNPNNPSVAIEQNGTREPLNAPGVYRHPATKAELILSPSGTDTAQADAVVRMGFERVGDAPSPQEIRKMQEVQAKADAKAEAAGKLPEPYLVPGTQEVVYNGSSTDVNGPGDTELALAAENASLKQQLADQRAEADAPATEVVTKDAPEAKPAEVEAPAEEPVASEAPVHGGDKNSSPMV